MIKFNKKPTLKDEMKKKKRKRKGKSKSKNKKKMSTKKSYEFDIKKKPRSMPSSVFMHLDFFF